MSVRGASIEWSGETGAQLNEHGGLSEKNTDGWEDTVRRLDLHFPPQPPAPPPLHAPSSIAWKQMLGWRAPKKICSLAMETHDSPSKQSRHFGTRLIDGIN